MVGMKLGFGLYKHMLDDAHYRFARQCGATHIIIHLVDYFNSKKPGETSDQPVGGEDGWGYAGNPAQLWTVDELVAIRNQVEKHGLTLAGIENFDPAHWHDILLDGPAREAQIEQCKTIIRNVGKAQIPFFGYNFSIAGVAGRTKGPFARGEAIAVGLDAPHPMLEKPIPKGMVWNMVYDPNPQPGFQESITHEELWRRLERFLGELLPVAEEAGVTMAAHPDDPPLKFVRQQPRLVYEPELYQKLLDLYDSTSNQLEFCLGTLAEMAKGDIYEVTDHYTKLGKVAYIHFRNVVGKVPHYRETFIDDGDINMKKIIGILKANKFDGVLIPDHAPLMSCAAPWHSGMAFSMGYMKALL